MSCESSHPPPFRQHAQADRRLRAAARALEARAVTDCDHKEVEGLALVIARLRERRGEILALERELRKESIDRVLQMDGLEAGLAFLTGKLRIPRD